MVNQVECKRVVREEVDCFVYSVTRQQRLAAHRGIVDSRGLAGGHPSRCVGSVRDPCGREADAIGQAWLNE